MNDSPNREDSDVTPDIQESDPWTKKLDKYASTMRTIALTKAYFHTETGHYYRMLEIKWGLPTVVVPAIFGPLVLMLSLHKECNDVYHVSDYVSSLGFIITGVTSAINGFFRFGNRSALHHMYSAKYSDIVTDIDVELARMKKFRLPADVFSTAIKIRFDNLVFGEPVIPKHIEEHAEKSHFVPS